jgi:hypothetical protein
MATSSSIKKLNPRLQSVFGILSMSDDTEIREVLSSIDETLMEFAKLLGANRAGWEGTGLDLIWYTSGQIEISSFIETGIDSNHCVSFILSLQPTWFYGDFLSQQEWEIQAEIYADCQHKVYCGNMHRVYELPSVTSTRPIDSVIALRKMAIELMQLGKKKPLEYWLKLAGESQS